jgi:hypothetical protein
MIPREQQFAEKLHAYTLRDRAQQILALETWWTWFS